MIDQDLSRTLPATQERTVRSRIDADESESNLKYDKGLNVSGANALEALMAYPKADRGKKVSSDKRAGRSREKEG